MCHQAETVAHQSLSSHRSEQFGREYGVLLKEWRLLQRAVFMIDKNDRIVHVTPPGFLCTLVLLSFTSGRA